MHRKTIWVRTTSLRRLHLCLIDFRSTEQTHLTFCCSDVLHDFLLCLESLLHKRPVFLHKINILIQTVVQHLRAGQPVSHLRLLISPYFQLPRQLSDVWAAGVTLWQWKHRTGRSKKKGLFLEICFKLCGFKTVYVTCKVFYNVHLSKNWELGAQNNFI